MNRKSTQTLVALGISAVLAGACGKSENRPAANAGPSRKITIAMIAKSSNNPVFLAARTGAEQAAKDLSARDSITVEVHWLTPPEEDGQVQAQRIQQAVNDGADAILISCSDAGKVTGAINDAVDRGVAVMTFDSDAPESKRFAYYGVDDVKTGAETMAELAKLMGGKGKVAILAGNQNAPNLQKRVQGAKAEAAKHPGMQIIGTFNHVETPQDAAAEVTRVDNAYPGIQGWAMIGGWALWTPSLLGELDSARMKIVSVDALPSQLAYVDRGEVPVLLAQPVYTWGYVGVQTIVEKLHDRKNPPEIIPMDLVRVTRANLGAWARQLRDWGFTDVSAAYLKM